MDVPRKHRHFQLTPDKIRRTAVLMAMFGSERSGSGSSHCFRALNTPYCMNMCCSGFLHDRERGRINDLAGSKEVYGHSLMIQV